MRVIGRIFSNLKSKDSTLPAEEPNLETVIRFSKPDSTPAETVNEAPADAALHHMADLLTKLSEEDRQFLLVAAQRMAR